MQNDLSTIRALRSDLALQLSRHFARSGDTQSALARRLGIPQPTLSKIANGQLEKLSLELLIRVAVRVGLPFTLVTGQDPTEAGVHVTAVNARALPAGRSNLSRVNDAAQDSLVASIRAMSPAERLEAQARMTASLVELRNAARGAATNRKILPGPVE